MKIIGITGSSGAGKTTLSGILNKRENVEVIDADKVAKQMAVPGNEYLQEIEKTFGKSVLFEDGNLNRKALAGKIYNDDEARNLLNELTFKYVANEILERIKKINNSKIEIVIIDAPLLFEAKLEKSCDFVVSLIADEELKIKRICKRDNIDEITAKKRLKIQHDNDYYIKKSDYVIYNSEDCNLEKEIEKILKK